MRTPPACDDPADECSPHEEVLRELVTPGDRCVELPGDHANEHAGEQRQQQHDGAPAQKPVSSGEEGIHRPQVLCDGDACSLFRPPLRRLGLSGGRCGEGTPPHREASASQVPLPHLLSNCFGTVSSTGFRKDSISGSVTLMPAAFSVATRLASWFASSSSCQATPSAIAASTMLRSVSLRLFQKSVFTMISRGVMMCPVKIRFFCTSCSL